MIAAACSWHEQHDQAANEIKRRLARREKMIVAALSGAIRLILGVRSSAKIVDMIVGLTEN